MPEAPVAPVEPAAAPPAAPAAPAAPWHGITEPEGTAYVANKGWQSIGDVIKSYQGAEKLIGRDPSTLLSMPRADDPAGFRAVMSKLGLPETPDKYDFGKPADGEPAFDESYMGWARNTFHKVGLPAEMAKQLTAEHNNYIKGLMTQQAADYDLAVQADKTALLKEWGGGHERMMNAAQNAAKSLGFTPEMVDAMEQSVGYAGTLKFFAQLGQKMGEDKFVSGSEGEKRFGDTLTPDDARQQWEAMKLDPVQKAALQDKQHPAHKATWEKQTKLFAIMYPNP
jgi:hypothetical protein